MIVPINTQARMTGACDFLDVGLEAPRLRESVA
jgi:hypothetical protein